MYFRQARQVVYILQVQNASLHPILRIVFHTQTLLHRSCYTQTHLHTDAFTQPGIQVPWSTGNPQQYDLDGKDPWSRPWNPWKVLKGPRWCISTWQPSTPCLTNAHAVSAKPRKRHTSKRCTSPHCDGICWLSFAAWPSYKALAIWNSLRPTSCRFYTQTLLHTGAFTHRCFYTQTLLHTDAFTHRCFYTQTLLHTDAFTHRRFYTQVLLHTDAFTHRRFYTQVLLHTDAFTHRCFYTQALWAKSIRWHVSWNHREKEGEEIKREGEIERSNAFPHKDLWDTKEARHHDAVDDLSCKQRWANIVAMEMPSPSKIHKQRLRKKLELRARMLWMIASSISWWQG